MRWGVVHLVRRRRQHDPGLLQIGDPSRPLALELVCLRERRVRIGNNDDSRRSEDETVESGGIPAVGRLLCFLLYVRTTMQYIFYSSTFSALLYFYCFCRGKNGDERKRESKTENQKSKKKMFYDG